MGTGHALPDDRTPAPRSVGIRALKQNASEVVARVKAGETVEITERGRPVARLTPIRTDRYQELVDAGVITPPKPTTESWGEFMKRHREELREQGLADDNQSGLTMEQILDEQRADRL